MKKPVPTLLMIIPLTCFAFLPKSQAVSPPPDGGYAGGNTAEGQSALLSLTTGSYNTALGLYSLLSDTAGRFNTGVGAATLLANTADENTATGTGALLSNTTGTENTANGAFALFFNTEGSNNTAIGDRTLQNNITGTDNTAIGVSALFFNTAAGNTAIGSEALLNNTTGGTLENIQGIDVGPNVAVGWQALEGNTLASANTAMGYQALHSFTTGPVGFEQVGLCTAVGFQALANATTGFFNSGFGYRALMNNTGVANTAIGAAALSVNTAGGDNTAAGVGALESNTSGSSNTAIGFSALAENDDGVFNTAVGELALNGNVTGAGNTAIGVFALQNSTGSNNTALGDGAGLNVTTASNVICIGINAVGANVDNSCFIDNIYSNVQPIVGTDPDSVTITSSGRLGRGNVSSRRYKHDIKPMRETSEMLYALKPVSFRYNKEYDTTQTLAFGLIAEEVAEVYPDLVGRNSKGEPESVHYEQINAMLLNEFLKEHCRVQEQQKEIDSLKTELREQRDLIQKVNDRVEMRERAELFTKNP
jgi:trimeric autotransporter adhesin